MLCIMRLIQMQLLPTSTVQSDIEQLKQQKGQSRQLKTVRGQIFDRAGRILATDEPHFQVCIDYQFSSFMDERVRKGKLLRAADSEYPDTVAKVQKELNLGLEDLEQVIKKCAQFRGVNSEDIRAEIKRMNDDIWDARAFQAWRRNFRDSDLIERYDNDVIRIPHSEAMADFEAKEPDETNRIRLVSKIDIAEMYEPQMLLELQTDDDIFAAQLEFLKVEGIRILPKAGRLYPYGTVASQTMGWVGRVTQDQDKQLFKDDRLASYLAEDIGGREDGVEYVCESILRGRRGEEFEDIDNKIVRTEISFGSDVTLTLDVELQKEIENYLSTYPHEPNRGPGMAAVVIDVDSSDILALVSMPVYDLNRARYDYEKLIKDSNKPLINRAINERYPPGSVVKPLILIAGLESGKITSEQTISCPAEKAPDNWPNCLLFKKFGVGHDGRWENNARNAIRGSCNIYFSRLAHRIDPLVLQEWLFKFGYGQRILFPPLSVVQNEDPRNFRQLSGIISNVIPKEAVVDFKQIPPLRENERRWFGIGQGALRATPLQVANSMATIARRGLFKLPRLFKSSVSAAAQNTAYDSSAVGRGVDLEISQKTLDVVYEGMSAVVNEISGTAHTTFEVILDSLDASGIKVYGKTGSTEAPEHAWFGGFVVDSEKRSIAIAVVVEGGQSGSSDAAPLARDIILLCIKYGYIKQSGN